MMISLTSCRPLSLSLLPFFESCDKDARICPCEMAKYLFKWIFIGFCRVQVVALGTLGVVGQSGQAAPTMEDAPLFRDEAIDERFLSVLVWQDAFCVGAYFFFLIGGAECNSRRWHRRLSRSAAATAVANPSAVVHWSMQKSPSHGAIDGWPARTLER